MSRQDHNIYEEWLYLEADGGLSTAERAQLHRHLLSCSRCRKESREVPAVPRVRPVPRARVARGRL